MQLYFINSDSILCYFETESGGEFSCNTARGKIDLKATNFELINDQAIEGSPTCFCILICFQSEEKWKLCADTKDDHIRWSKVLAKYASNKIILPPNSPIASSSLPPKVFIEEAQLDKQLRSKSEPIITKSTISQSNPALPLTTCVQSHSKAGKKRLRLATKATSMETEWLEALLVLIIINICFYAVTKSQEVITWMYIGIANFVVWHSLYLRNERTKLAKVTATKEAEIDSEEKLTKRPSIVFDVVKETEIPILAGDESPVSIDSTNIDVRPIPGILSYKP